MIPVFVGENPIDLAPGVSLLEHECGGIGPEVITQLTAPGPGAYNFSLNPEFDGLMYPLDAQCEMLDYCAGPGDLINPTLEFELDTDDTIYMVVDSNAGGMMGTLTIELY